MIFKKGQKLFALTRTRILRVKIISTNNNTKYTIEGFFDNRGREEVREYSEELLEKSRLKPYSGDKNSIDCLVFYTSKIIALTQFHENILKEMQNSPLILPRYQLKDILEDIENDIEKHRTTFFAKNISDGTETAEQEASNIEKKELA